jgi:hypothetical protein
MATSSILGGDRPPSQSSGRDTDALGPSDTSDSGSDIQGERGFDALGEGEVGAIRIDQDSDTDAEGTGERGAAVPDRAIVEGADIAPDHIEGPDADADSPALDAEARAADAFADDGADALEDEEDEAAEDERRTAPRIGARRDPGN